MCSDRRARAVIAAGAALLLLTACGPASHGPQVAYRGAESERPLEMPPELTRPESPGAASMPAYDPGERVLPEFRDIELVRAGPSSWLEIRGAGPEDVWPQVQAFLRSEGLEVRVERPEMGLIETDWAQRFDAPSRGGITGLLDNVLGRGDTGIRDRYQFRLERMAGGTGTRVFVSHWIAEDRPRSSAARRDHEGFEWDMRGGDPAVITEMQRRLLLYVGLREERAARIVATDGTVGVGRDDAAYEESGDIASVDLEVDDADEAWARTGDSLTRLGAEITGADPERGIYRLRWHAPGEGSGGGGIFAVFRGGDGPEAREFVVQVRPGGGGSRIVAAAAGGGLEPDARGLSGVPASGTAERALLQRLADGLNGIVAPRPIAADRDATADDELEDDDGGAMRRSRHGGYY